MLLLKNALFGKAIFEEVVLHMLSHALRANDNYYLLAIDVQWYILLIQTLRYHQNYQYHQCYHRSSACKMNPKYRYL